MSAIRRIEQALVSGGVPAEVQRRVRTLVASGGPFRCQHVRLHHERPGSVRIYEGAHGSAPHVRESSPHSITLLALLRGEPMPPPEEES